MFSVKLTDTHQNRRYWDQTSTGNPIVPSRTSIMETLTKVTANPPKIAPKLTINFIEKAWRDMRKSFREHPFLSWGCVLGIAFGCLSWFRGGVLAALMLLRGRLRRVTGGGGVQLPMSLPLPFGKPWDAAKDGWSLKAPLVGGWMNRGSKAD